MTQSRDGIDGKPPRFSFWSGRSSRKEYWSLIGVLVAMAVGISLIGLETNSSVFAVPVAMVQARRLRDVGWSGGWAVAIFVGGLAAGLVLGLSGLAKDTILSVAGVLTIIPIIWLGALPGDPHHNRFGPPPGQRALKDVFS